MVKLTSDLISQSIQYVNPLRDRELLLRGYKIPVIENLGATLDQFDTIDFTDNDIRKLEGFPLLPRLQSLLFSNNRICRIDENLHTNIPNLRHLYLTNCDIRDFVDIENLVKLKKLEYLSLMRNPVATKKNYRLYVIHKLPQVRVLDFQRIKMKERNRAKEFFASKSGRQVISDLGKQRKTFTPGEPINNEFGSDGMSKADKEAIKEAILNAKNLEEIEKLRQLLQSGKVPGRDSEKDQNGKSVAANGDNDVEMEEEE